MAEGRATETRERAESPALEAGLSGSEPRSVPRTRWRRVAAHLMRPEIAAAALASYRYERRTELAMPISGTLLEGGFIGVIADKLYHVHPSVLALITAAPMFGLLSSVLWARLAAGRRKVPFITALMTGVVVCAATISIPPNGPIGPWLLVGGQILARLILGGVITVRTVSLAPHVPCRARARVPRPHPRPYPPRPLRFAPIALAARGRGRHREPRRSGSSLDRARFPRRPCTGPRRRAPRRLPDQGRRRPGAQYRTGPACRYRDLHRLVRRQWPPAPPRLARIP